MISRVRAVDLGFVTLLTLAGRAVYIVAGVRFDTSPFPTYMQFIDAKLLDERLFESLWYSHAHPPGLNLLVGSFYRAFGEQAPTALSLFFHGLGLVFAAGVFALTLRLTGARVAAYLTTALLVMSPGFVLYENWLMYTFLEVVLLTISAVALYQALDRGSIAWAVTLFTALAALVLTRGLFHLGWFVLVVAYVTWAAPQRWRTIAAAALPLLASTLWYAKNYFYFGTFAGSTVFGLGFSNIGTLTVPRADLAPLVEQGIISPLALVSRYQDVSLLFSAGNEPPSGIAVLDSPRKSDGEYNYNYRPLIAIDAQYARDSLAVIRQYPGSYAIGVVIANRLFFSPSSMNEYFSPQNRAAAKPFERFFNPVLYGVPGEPSFIVQPHFGFDVPPSLEVNTSVSLIALWALALALGWLRVRRLFFAPSVEDRVVLVTLGYLLSVMVYVHVLGTLVELGENYRYRFVVEPFLAVVIAVIATGGMRRLAARWSSKRES